MKDMYHEALRPKVGVGVIIHDNNGNIVMGERAGSHGAGTPPPQFHYPYSLLLLLDVYVS